MRKVADIVDYLDSFWKDNAFSDSRFHGITQMGLCIQVPKNSDPQTISVVQDKIKGEYANYESIKGSIQSYHRIMSSARRAESKNDADSFGDELQPQSRSIAMSMLMFADKKIGISADQLELILMASMPTKAPVTTGYQSINFLHTGSEFNQRYLMEREYGIKDFTLEPDVVLIEFKYTIECVYASNCIKTLCCPT